MGPLLAVALAAGEPLPEPVMADIRCLVSSFAIAATPGFESVGLMAGFYWFGRVDTALKDEERLEQAIAGEATRMTAADYRLESSRCGKEMEGRGKAMSRIGESLRRRAERSDTH